MKSKKADKSSDILNKLFSDKYNFSFISPEVAEYIHNHCYHKSSPLLMSIILSQLAESEKRNKPKNHEEV